MHKFNSTFAFTIHAKQLIFTFTCNSQAYRLILKTIIVLHLVFLLSWQTVRLRRSNFGGNLLGENLSKYKHGTLRLNLLP